MESCTDMTSLAEAIHVIHTAGVTVVVANVDEFGSSQHVLFKSLDVGLIAQEIRPWSSWNAI